MIESGSFRDPSSRVFYLDDRVLRGLNAEATAIDAAVRASGLMDKLVARGLFVENWPVDNVSPPDGIPSDSIIESRRIATINYPAEWSFLMLKDAALATLDANLLALDQGFILKDASAFNVVFTGTTPTIIDITSLDEFAERGIWTAYGQFCDHFLAPLMLEAYTGLPYQRMIHGQIDGIPIVELNKLLRGRTGIHKGVLNHVRLRSRLEQRAARMTTQARRNVGQLLLPRAAVVGSIRKMRKLVADLESTAPSTWSRYEEALPYEKAATDAKADFVRTTAAGAAKSDLAVDVGANAGLFTLILSEYFENTIGLDNDQGAIDALYAATSASGTRNLTPLVVDITNPTPGFGWRGTERAAFVDRIRPDLATWLAVVHHLCLGIGLPLESVVSQILDFSTESVVEFVAPDDPMAQRISASRTTDLAPYNRDLFESYAAAYGTVVSKLEVNETRTMYHLKVR